VRHLLHVAKGALAASFLLLSPVANAQTPKREEWKPETFELANGMKAVVLPDHRAPVVTHMLWYRVGSADEETGKSGLAHLLEHLMFKATAEIPAGEYSKIVARNGGKDRLPLMMRMEAGRMQHLKLDEAEVIPERDVVKEERRQNVESNPGAVLEEKVFSVLYAGHPYGIPVIGHMSEVAKLSRDDAFNWYKAWYGPENAILVVAGDVTAAELKPLAEEIYGNVPRRGDLKVRTWPAVKPLEKSSEITHSDPKVRQPSWARYWIGAEIGAPDSEALHIAMEILGGGRTSRLYRELVEKDIAVMTYGYSMEMEAPGMVYMSVSPNPAFSLDDVKKAALAVTDKFLKEGPTAEELNRAKKTIAASEIFTRDNQRSMAEWYGTMLTAGQTVPQIESWDDRIAAVTAEQVKAAANKYLTKHHVDAKLLPEGR
jgi:zinc protease